MLSEHIRNQNKLILYLSSKVNRQNQILIENSKYIQNISDDLETKNIDIRLKKENI